MAMNLDKVAPRLYVGGIFSARTSSFDRNDITHVLSVTPDVRTLPGNAKTVKAHKCLEDVADRPDVDILRYLPEGVGFIEEALDTSEENRVLVHCTQGVSRSVTFVCAYLMKRRKISPIEALALVRTSRPIATPNSGFMRQLAVYEKCHYFGAADFSGVETCAPYQQWLKDAQPALAGDLL